jgi:hypothetical protein
VVRSAADSGVLLASVGERRLRCVTHKDVDAAAVQRAADVLHQLFVRHHG